MSATGAPSPAEITAQLVQVAAEQRTRGTVLFLTVDPRVAMDRAVGERGPIWLNRHVGADVDSKVDASRISEAAETYQRAARSWRQQFAAEGWQVTDIDAGEPIERVTGIALPALSLQRKYVPSGIPARPIEQQSR